MNDVDVGFTGHHHLFLFARHLRLLMALWLFLHRSQTVSLKRETRAHGIIFLFGAHDSLGTMTNETASMAPSI